MIPFLSIARTGAEGHSLPITIGGVSAESNRRLFTFRKFAVGLPHELDRPDGMPGKGNFRHFDHERSTAHPVGVLDDPPVRVRLSANRGFDAREVLHALASGVGFEAPRDCVRGVEGQALCRSVMKQLFAPIVERPDAAGEPAPAEHSVADLEEVRLTARRKNGDGGVCHRQNRSVGAERGRVVMGMERLPLVIVSAGSPRRSITGFKSTWPPPVSV